MIDRATALQRAMVEQRVGGSFWDPYVAHEIISPIVLRPADMGQAQAMLAASAEIGSRRCLAVLPATRWAKGAAMLFEREGVEVHVGPTDPWSLLSGADSLHADGNDELIFLALLAGIRVRTVSSGLFAGWGLTEDAPGVATKGKLDLLRLIHAMLIEGATYRNCFTSEAMTAEETIAQLGFWRQGIDANRGIAAACGIAWWKRREIRAFLWDGSDSPLHFHRRARPAVRTAAMRRADIAVWPSRAPAGLDAAAAEAQVPVRQVEDGFIRSVGLGSALHPPLSIVVDRKGIYYDPTRPSDLETLLSETRFSQELLDRAERLISVIVAAGISKYASGRGRFTDIPAEGRRVLVTGQVEDDRSVLLGGGGVAGNLDLVRRARAAEPDAYIIFKPHPDVEAGHRKGAVADAVILRFADRIVRDAAMPALLDAVDAVHVWTSLAGFEALLRGREVFTHGQPFFAGWGLTTDLGPPVARRTRRLSVTELVTGALILYPRYLDPMTLLPCAPEILIARLAQSGGAQRTLLTELRRLQGRMRVRLAGRAV
ncbi:hypothetical protein [Sphingomonas oleivorans]|nr:hypothetical protein [Sphingomonas oleivorans]